MFRQPTNNMSNEAKVESQLLKLTRFIDAYAGDGGAAAVVELQG
jgi:hypothetical protein